MTTHELAQQLMNLPDVQVVIEQWIAGCGEPYAVMTQYDPEGTAIIVQGMPTKPTHNPSCEV